MLTLMLLTACSPSGSWTLTAWGEEYIEDEIPSDDFEDGCSVTYDSFEVTISGGALLDGNGDAVVEMDGSQVIDVAATGPHDVVTLDRAPAGTYDSALYVVEGSTAAGTLSCPNAGDVTFDWSFDVPTTYNCELDALEVVSGEEAVSEATIHGDHLFYDHLEDPDAGLEGEATAAADADDDGIVTQEELAAVSVAPLGYGVGRFSDVTDMDAFVAVLSRTLGHIDGEGHCDTDL